MSSLNPNSKEFSFNSAAREFRPSGAAASGRASMLNPSSQAFRPSGASGGSSTAATSTSSSSVNAPSQPFHPAAGSRSFHPTQQQNVPSSQKLSLSGIDPSRVREFVPYSASQQQQQQQQKQASSSSSSSSYQRASESSSTMNASQLQSTSREFVPSFRSVSQQQQQQKQQHRQTGSTTGSNSRMQRPSGGNQKFKFVNSKPFFPLSENQPPLFTQMSKDAHASKHTMKSLFVNENLRYFLLEKSLFRHQILHPQFAQFYFPMEVRTHSLVYHSIFPLFRQYQTSKVFPGHQVGVFKAVQSTSNTMVTLVRVQESSSQSANILRSFKMMNHPNIVKLKHHFFSNQFQQQQQQNGSSNGSQSSVGSSPAVTSSGGDSSQPSSLSLGSKKELIIVYDHIDYCESMHQLYIVQRILSLPKEKDIWSFMCQIFSALDYIHSKGLSYDCMNLRKVLVSPQMKRIHLGSLGLYRIFNEKDSRTIEERQSEDIRGVAQMMVQLLSGTDDASVVNTHNFINTLQNLRGKISDELVSFLQTLWKSGRDQDDSADSSRLTTKDVIQQYLGYHMMTEMINLNRHANTIEHELSKELENGRLFRLLVKLNHVMQRMFYEPHMSRWSEEGDLYILRLFFEHLFHRRNPEDGSLHVDWVHLIENLNKLDVGSTDTVLLASPEDQNILVLNYNEIRECFQNAYREMLQDM